MYWTHPLITNKQYEVVLSDLEPFMMFNTQKELFSTVHPSSPTTNDPNSDIVTNDYQNIECVPTNATLNLTLYDKCKLRALSVKKCQDSLFWTLYLAIYGRSEYERIGGCTNGNVEMSEKNKVVDYVKKQGAKNISALLNTKMTKVALYDMCSELLTLPRMSWKHIPLLCAYYNCNLYYIDLMTRTYLPTVHTTDFDHDINTFVLYKNDKKGPQYWIDIGEQITKLTEIKMQYFLIKDCEKPLKAVSSYKLSDLELIANLLKVSCTGKYKKQDLYNKIAECLGNLGNIK